MKTTFGELAIGDKFRTHAGYALIKTENLQVILADSIFSYPNNVFTKNAVYLEGNNKGKMGWIPEDDFLVEKLPND